MGGFWKWRQIEGWKSEKFAIFQMDITFFLFEVQRWLRYEKYSFFIELFEKQHRVTPKRNKRNKSNTLDQACLAWPKLPKFNIGYSFTKLIQEHFPHHIRIENHQTKSVSKFCSDYFFDMTLEKKKFESYIFVYFSLSECVF